MLLFSDGLGETGKTQRLAGKHLVMGIGVSILVIAIGAVLTFAVTAQVSGVDLNVVGVVLMTVGAIGLLWALVTAASVGPFGRHKRVVDHR